nr:DUF2127 domain-containing protein [Candidatus Omnitrophota bacterium]
MKNAQRVRTIIHKGFEIGILLKGINGLLEIVGGALLLFIRTEMVPSIIAAVTYHELSEDPHDIVANYLMHAAQNLSISTQLFGVIYLLSHGIVKIFLIVSLWKRKLWAYPVAMGVFGIFIIYQMYRYTIVPAVELIILTVLDVIIIILTWLEFKQLRSMESSLKIVTSESK